MGKSLNARGGGAWVKCLCNVDLFTGKPTAVPNRPPYTCSGACTKLAKEAPEIDRPASDKVLSGGGIR